MKRFVVPFLTFGCVVLAATLLIAGTTKLTLKDGTVLEGEAKRLASGTISIKTSGGLKLVPAGQVEKIEGDLAGGVAPGAPGGTPPVVTGKAGPNFNATKAKADRVDQPVLAVQIWDKFIEDNASSPDLTAAKAERAKWDALDKSKAMKIKGKWVGGDELKDFKKKYAALVKEGTAALEGTQTVLGIQKLEEALKMYPESFEANFFLGRFYLIKGVTSNGGRGDNASLDKGVKALETAAKAMPDSAATWSNLAIAYNFRKRYEEAVLVAYKAAKMEDTPDIVQNLVNALDQAPPAMRTKNAKIVPIVDDATILASKHGVRPGDWRYISPSASNPDRIVEAGAQPAERPGPVWSGSGFFISPDGYFITNHHVATGDPEKPIRPDIAFRIKMDDGKEMNATLVAVDDKADIALMKVKNDSPLPYFKIAAENPNMAAKALVLGYPATGDENSTLQISEGQVKSIHEGEFHEVWFDLNTTHGNSGGPIVDKNGRIISILTGGRTIYNVTYVLGTGPLQIKRFLESLGDKAPKPEYAGSRPQEFDGEALTAECKKATIFVLAIKLKDGEKAPTMDDKVPTTKPATTKPDASAAKGVKTAPVAE